MGRPLSPIDQETATVEPISVSGDDFECAQVVSSHAERCPEPDVGAVDLISEDVNKIMDSLKLAPALKEDPLAINEHFDVSEEISGRTEEPHVANEEKPFLPINRSCLDEECEAFCRHINCILPVEKFAILEKNKYLPLKVSSFFDSLRDGVVLAFLLNAIQPNMIPISSICIGIKISKMKSSYKALHNLNENLRLVLDGAKKIRSIHLVNIGAEDIQSGNKHLILGLVWQLIRQWYVSGLNNLSPPASEDKIASTSQKDLSAEGILIRWINDILCLDQPISNLGGDMADCKIYAMLLDKIFESDQNGQKIGELVEKEPNYEARAALITTLMSSKLPYVRAEDISNPRLNLCIVADLFKCSQSVVKNHAEEVKNSRAEISGWEATLQAERSSYASQLASLSEQHSKTIEELEQKLSQTYTFFNEQQRAWEQQSDSVGIAIAALATRINHISPEGGKDLLPLSTLLQNSSSSMELISYCQTQLDRIEAFQKRLLDDKSKLCTTISLNKHANELMSARVREFSQELAEKKKAPSVSSRGAKSLYFKSKILSWGSGASSARGVRSELN
ncbi:hypothetical protein MDAP_001139 [Mitosporidium daphniae]|uniref:Calponin-homology (CH) domain-containing protein n=1 Tax=Mitosporidium daphniae TaxID=1485682 RepID=A0A098VUB2_9MICR|nr:uncharacterized protein DI09_17p190 [Mitosporidium daphniae]KGG52389.1 hypothetical protein DI09_17p190 [Mitosporidium daphniae]|eukprot:XP_013238816.1 uncharacterized protein DI09_17p190 [Mitosporidium daphniae]